MRLFMCALTIIAAACGTPARTISAEEPVSTQKAPQGSWIVSLDSTGGMTGHGVGRIRIVSNGDITAAMGGEEISATLRPDEQQALATTVATSDVTEWGSATHHRGGDQITYTLNLERGADRGVAVWMDGNADTAPADARRLAQVAWEIHRRVWDEARQ